MKSPETFSGIIQWQKLYDRNPLYHTLVDKAEVKKYVASRIGEEAYYRYVLPDDTVIQAALIGKIL